MKINHLIDSAKNRRKARKASHWKSSGKRFYSQLDMATIKYDEAIRNSKIKRGEIEPKGNNQYISHCGCGACGCFIIGDFATVDRDFYR